MLSPLALQNVEQMLVNEALVARIFESEKTESALRASVRNFNELLEQQRNARAINDQLGRDLLAMRAEVAMLHARTSRWHGRLHRRVDAVLGRLDGAIDSAKQAGADLRPGKLVKGLVAAVEAEVSRFRQASGLLCRVTIEPLAREVVLPTECAVALYRTFQQCLSNVVRHSNARRVDIIVELLDDKVVLNVFDDGIVRARPDADALAAGEQRIAALGGALCVASSPAHGTAVTLSLPIV